MGKRGQIWVETVIYTLIALVLIGVVLTYVEPKMEEMQDRSLIEKSIYVLDDINSRILEISEGGTGNQRLIKLVVQKGEFKFNDAQDQIIFEMETKLDYSELGENINVGGVIVRTDKKGNINIVTLILDYSGDRGYDIQTSTDPLVLNRAPKPYNIIISNRGESDLSLRPIINISLQ